MSDATHTITAIATDAAGNVSAASEALIIAVDTTAPVYQSMSVHSNGGGVGDATLELQFDSPLDNASANSPLASYFSVSTNGANNPVTGVTISGDKVILILQDAISSGALSVVVQYSDGTSADSLTAIQDFAGNDANNLAVTSGVVADGYIRGAQIYLDAPDGLQILNGVVTDAFGNFYLQEGVNPNGYALVAVGGVNIDTGLPNVSSLKAPAGATTVNPLTTLVVAVMAATDSTDANAAAENVAAALGLQDSLPSGKTLLSHDPLSTASSENTAIQKAAAQIATVVTLAARDTTSSEEVSTIVSTVVENLAAVITSASQSTGPVNLQDTAVLDQILDGVQLLRVAVL